MVEKIAQNPRVSEVTDSHDPNTPEELLESVQSLQESMSAKEKLLEEEVAVLLGVVKRLKSDYEGNLEALAMIEEATTLLLA